MIIPLQLIAMKAEGLPTRMTNMAVFSAVAAYAFRVFLMQVT